MKCEFCEMKSPKRVKEVVTQEPQQSPTAPKSYWFNLKIPPKPKA